jgi:ArsR family transcriptional regulator, arsenate/arsenite/antimonite-responsive transcriptional repressor
MPAGQLVALRARDGAIRCRCISADGIASHKLLIDAGLLEREQRGRCAYYRLVLGALDTLTTLLSGVARPL